MHDFKKLGAPTDFWDYFEIISKIPRGTGKEEQLRNFIRKEANRFEF